MYFSEIARELKINCENDGKVEFEKLEELNIIKPYIIERVKYINSNRNYYETPTGFETGYENLRRQI